MFPTWEELKEALSSLSFDETYGGTSSFFSSPYDAHNWFLISVLRIDDPIASHLGLTSTQVEQMEAASSSARNSAWWTEATSWAISPYDATLLYWQELKKSAQEIAPNNVRLKELLNLATQTSQEVTERGKNRELPTKIPFWVWLLGAGMIYGVIRK